MADPEVTIPLPDPPDPPPHLSTPQLTPRSGASLEQQVDGAVIHSGEPSSPSPNSSSSTPPWLRWSRGLNSLLDDGQGRDLFERYLEQEGCSAQLTFLWACEGLKCTALKDPPKIPQLVRKIYHHFIQNVNLLGLKEDSRSNLAQAFVDGRFTEVHIFDRAEEEVLTHMKDNLYPNFLKSEIYLSAANGEDLTSSSASGPTDGALVTERRFSEGEDSTFSIREEDESISEKISQNFSRQVTIDPLTGESIPFKTDESRLSPGKVPSPPLTSAATASVQALLPNQLQTVHEDLELTTNPHLQAHSSKMKLTKGALLATQSTRATVLAGVNKMKKSESAPGHYITKHVGPSASAPFPYHASYSSYNPVSRVDSEIQSLSSDAMTDDGVHGSHHSSRKQGHRSQQQHRSHSHGSMNPLSHHLQSDRRRQQISGIPMGARVDNRDNLPMPNFPGGPNLSKVPNREAELDPRAFASILSRKLEEVKRERDTHDRLIRRISESDDHNQGGEAITPHVLAAAINRLQLQDEELPADILDKHMSRVFADVTPTTRSPRLRSPTIGRRRGGAAPPELPPQRSRRREYVSTFSVDSGNVHDYPSSVEMSKSRNIPYELSLQQRQGDFSSFGSGVSRGHSTSTGGGVGHMYPKKVPLGMFKKTSSEFLDSGISVISGATPTLVPPPPQPPSEAMTDDGGHHNLRKHGHRLPDAPCDVSDLRVREWMEQCGEEGLRIGRPGGSPPSHRCFKKPSSSQMSAPLPPTATLEEARRRLTKKLPQPPIPLQSSFQMPSMNLNLAGSSSSIPRHHSPPSSEESLSIKECISSFVIYDDSDVPFVLKIPKMKGGLGSGVTLSSFKEHLPKRGHYRYFFKTECAELDAKVVQEEVTNDYQELPLYEGRLFAHLQAVSAGTPSLPTQLPFGTEK